MINLIDEFKYRRSLLEKLDCGEAQSRLVAFLSWLEVTAETSKILFEIRKFVDQKVISDITGRLMPQEASTPEEIAAVGLEIMQRFREGDRPNNISSDYQIYSPGNYSTQANFNEVMRRYIWPCVKYIERQLIDKDGSRKIINRRRRTNADLPLEIIDSLGRFNKDNPHYKRNAFVMMPFGETKGHNSIIRVIRLALEKYGIKGLRADDKSYHDDLFPNVLTYLWGCSIGIAVFERLVVDDFNPNVSLEVGYMRALGKPICLLKDKTLKTLQTDLVGKLYSPFDPQDPEGSIPESLEKWLRDKEIISL